MIQYLSTHLKSHYSRDIILRTLLLVFLGVLFTCAFLPGLVVVIWCSMVLRQHLCLRHPTHSLKVAPLPYRYHALAWSHLSHSASPIYGPVNTNPRFTGAQLRILPRCLMRLGNMLAPNPKLKLYDIRPQALLTFQLLQALCASGH